VAERGARARDLVLAGRDIVVAYGYEAVGHIVEIAGTVLVPEIVDAAGAEVPVHATGGIGSGPQIAAALTLGASKVWMGSVWMIEYTNLSPLPALREALAATAVDEIIRWTSPVTVQLPLGFLDVRGTCRPACGQ
jgi:NAD(P)H-dependent flavin oxidoreductase YrpB (nitropropane dioxygenase family)